jgi:hypothetical protein
MSPLFVGFFDDFTIEEFVPLLCCALEVEVLLWGVSKLRLQNAHVCPLAAILTTLPVSLKHTLCGMRHDQFATK